MPFQKIKIQNEIINILKQQSLTQQEQKYKIFAAKIIKFLQIRPAYLIKNLQKKIINFLFFNVTAFYSNIITHFKCTISKIIFYSQHQLRLPLTLKLNF